MIKITAIVLFAFLGAFGSTEAQTNPPAPTRQERQAAQAAAREERNAKAQAARLARQKAAADRREASRAAREKATADRRANVRVIRNTGGSNLGSRSSYNRSSYGSRYGQSTVIIAQPSQEAATRIADSVEPSEVLPDQGATCLERAAAILPAKDAASFCLTAIKEEAKRGKKVANEAADAAQASRPIIRN